MAEKKIKRETYINIRLTFAELEAIRSKAEGLGLSISDYGRARLLDFSDKFIWKDGDIIFFNKDDEK